MALPGAALLGAALLSACGGAATRVERPPLNDLPGAAARLAVIPARLDVDLAALDARLHDAPDDLGALGHRLIALREELLRSLIPLLPPGSEGAGRWVDWGIDPAEPIRVSLAAPDTGLGRVLLAVLRGDASADRSAEVHLVAHLRVTATAQDAARVRATLDALASRLGWILDPDTTWGAEPAAPDRAASGGRDSDAKPKSDVRAGWRSVGEATPLLAVYRQRGAQVALDVTAWSGEGAEQRALEDALARSGASLPTSGPLRIELSALGLAAWSVAALGHETLRGTADAGALTAAAEAVAGCASGWAAVADVVAEVRIDVAAPAGFVSLGLDALLGDAGMVAWDAGRAELPLDGLAGLPAAWQTGLRSAEYGALISGAVPPPGLLSRCVGTRWVEVLPYLALGPAELGRLPRPTPPGGYATGASATGAAGAIVAASSIGGELVPVVAGLSRGAPVEIGVPLGETATREKLEDGERHALFGQAVPVTYELRRRGDAVVEIIGVGGGAVPALGSRLSAGSAGSRSAHAFVEAVFDPAALAAAVPPDAAGGADLGVLRALSRRFGRLHLVGVREGRRLQVTMKSAPSGAREP